MFYVCIVGFYLRIVKNALHVVVEKARNFPLAPRKNYMKLSNYLYENTLKMNYSICQLRKTRIKRERVGVKLYGVVLFP